MLQSYVPILVLLTLAAGTAGVIVALSILLGPRKHSAIKDQPFECGTVGTGSPAERFSVKFYLVAVVFILFDIEVVFLYPWAVQAVGLGWFGFAAIAAFLLIVVTGLVYVWKRGVLDWS